MSIKEVPMAIITQKVKTSRSITSEYISEFSALGYQVELHYNDFDHTYFALMFEEDSASLKGKGIGMTAIVALDNAYEDLLSKSQFKKSRLAQDEPRV
jgi:hypothetical protein